MVDHDEWQPISLAELQGEINGALGRMNATQRKLWDVICITPEKWQQDPYGKEGGGEATALGCFLQSGRAETTSRPLTPFTPLKSTHTAPSAVFPCR